MSRSLVTRLTCLETFWGAARPGWAMLVIRLTFGEHSGPPERHATETLLKRQIRGHYISFRGRLGPMGLHHRQRSIVRFDRSWS